MPTFLSANPIGDTDILALPVKEVGPAVAYYQQVLGFQATERSDNTAILVRDQATIGLAVNGKDPEQASCYLEVENLDALREELVAKGSSPTPFRIDNYGGNQYRVFFDKEPYGVCFCFGTKLTT